MKLEFNDNSRNRVHQCLNATNYAMKNIHPADKRTLLKAMFCTKFKESAMVDFHTRDMQSYKQLKRKLEANIFKRAKHSTFAVRV